MKIFLALVLSFKNSLRLYPVLSTIVLKMESVYMFESLFLTKSKIRQEILTLFFTNPSQRYYLRELEKLLGRSAGSIRRELLRFQKDNLFQTHPVGNLLYYSLNVKHPLFKEIKTIVFKTTGIEGSLKKALNQIDKIQFAFIYGSYAQEREKSTSDVDLFIIGDPDIHLLNKKIVPLEQKLKREINTTTYSLKEYLERKKNKSGFILDILEKPKLMLIGKENDL